MITNQRLMRYKGIEYVVARHPEIGHLLGYVKLPEKHPYQKFIDMKRKFPKFKREFFMGYDSMKIDCHGGLTFSRRITKKNQENYPQNFTLGSWIGWDYAHLGDYVPGMPFAFSHNNEKEWTEKEVEKECKNVINQLLK